MNILFVLIALLALVTVGIAVYLLTARSYNSADSVANSYDQWTEDGILEFYWGEHIHLGHYGSLPIVKTSCKPNMILSMRWWPGAGWINSQPGQPF